MAVNGIELAVGQKWRTRDGNTTMIVVHHPAYAQPWGVSEGSRLSDDGRVYSGGHDTRMDLIQLLEKAPAFAPTETLAEAFAAEGKKTEDALRAGVTQLADDLICVEREIAARPELAAPYGGQGGDEFQVGVQFKQTHVFQLSVGDEVTLTEAGLVLIVTDLHGGHTDHQYQGVAEGSPHRVAFSNSDVFSFRPNSPLQPTAELPVGLVEPPVSAPDILDAAAGHLRDRAASYDKPEGERSMAQTVAIFNLHHGTEITEAQGWHFMQVLKDVRTFTNPAKPHRDSIEDAVSYAALKGEALLGATHG